MLQALAERGSNVFSSFVAAEGEKDWRYPVFVRDRYEHSGALSSLLFSVQAVREVITRLVVTGRELADLLVVEFCDTKDQRGLYRKYGAFRVGNAIVPRNILFDMQWHVKDQYPVAISHLEETFEYCEANPHSVELMEIFEMAGIEYGRIDYALLDGRIQVWEINTNPLILRPPEGYPQSLPLFSQHLDFLERIAKAFNELDVQASAPGGSIEVNWGEVLDFVRATGATDVPRHSAGPLARSIA
jgi:hypothetical protein